MQFSVECRLGYTQPISIEGRSTIWTPIQAKVEATGTDLYYMGFECMQ